MRCAFNLFRITSSMSMTLLSKIHMYQLLSIILLYIYIFFDFPKRKQVVISGLKSAESAAQRQARVKQERAEKERYDKQVKKEREEFERKVLPRFFFFLFCPFSHLFYCSKKHLVSQAVVGSSANSLEGVLSQRHKERIPRMI